MVNVCLRSLLPPVYILFCPSRVPAARPEVFLLGIVIWLRAPLQLQSQSNHPWLGLLAFNPIMMSCHWQQQVASAARLKACWAAQGLSTQL